MNKIIAIMMSLLFGLIFIGAPPAQSEEEIPPEQQMGASEYSVTSTTTVTDPDTGKSTVVEEDVSTVQSDDYGSGGWFSPFPTGCRTVKLENKIWNVTHTQVGMKFNTSMRWCWDRKAKKVYNIVRQHDTDVSCCFIEKKGITEDDGHWYDWAAGYAPKSGYDDDREYQFTQCISWCRHFYTRNIIRAHSDGSWSWRMEEDGG